MVLLAVLGAQILSVFDGISLKNNWRTIGADVAIG